MSGNGTSVPSTAEALEKKVRLYHYADVLTHELVNALPDHPQFHYTMLQDTLIRMGVNMRIYDLDMSDVEAKASAHAMLENVMDTGWMDAVFKQLPSGQLSGSEQAYAMEDIQAAAQLITDLGNQHLGNQIHVFELTIAYLLMAFSIAVKQQSDSSDMSEATRSHLQQQIEQAV